MQTLIHSRKSSFAFSLVEVVVAVGIFAISIVAVIGLLGPTNKGVADVRDTDDATRVVNAIQAQLQTTAETSAGWTSIVGFMRTAAQVQTDDQSATFDPTTSTYTLYASRDGSRINVYNPASSPTFWQGTDPANPTVVINNWNGLKYFEITLIRNGDSPAVGDGLSPAANDNTAGFLAFTIRLRWPAFLPNGTQFGKASTTFDNTQKSVLLVPAAVHR